MSPHVSPVCPSVRGLSVTGRGRERTLCCPGLRRPQVPAPRPLRPAPTQTGDWAAISRLAHKAEGEKVRSGDMNGFLE